jgi:hypothetical protein
VGAAGAVVGLIAEAMAVEGHGSIASN